ncbi:ABC transporter permease [Saxibacter everestensis]|uniref:ABC transporter permease n=1 Tax=Saxibacter everestensis TaxID=2909229 RepID=A0ABY8QRD0_9MICO|nr:ABC transporter permease [Brevibacteriaceae bacterium ZFBP1038]
MPQTDQLPTRPTEAKTRPGRKPRLRLGSVIFAIAVTLIVLFVLAPLLVVAASSVTSSGYLKFPPQGFSLQWFGAAAENSKFVESFSTSIRLALGTMIISVVCGVLAAYAINRYPGRIANFLEQLFLSPLMLPAVVFGLGFLFVLSAFGYRGSFSGALLAHVIVASPFVIRSTLAGFRSMDSRLEEAARSLGAGPLRSFFTVVLPGVAGSVSSGAIFAFVISFDEAVVTLFLTGPGFETLPVTIFTYVQYSNDPTVAAVSTVLLIFCAVLVAVMMRLGKDGDER